MTLFLAILLMLTIGIAIMALFVVMVFSLLDALAEGEWSKMILLGVGIMLLMTSGIWAIVTMAESNKDTAHDTCAVSHQEDE